MKLVVCALFCNLVAALVGVDLSVNVAFNEWDAIEETLADTISSVTVHAVFYNSTLNPNTVPILLSAYQRGITDLNLYVYPCIEDSSYSRTNSYVSCPSAEKQLETIVKHMKNFNIDVGATDDAPSAAHPSGYTPISFNNTAPNNIFISKIFVNIEDRVPNYYFSTDHSKNINFLVEYVNAAVANGISIGIYTTKADWLSIMPDLLPGILKVYRYKIGPSYTAINPFKDLPLWMPRYDGLSNNEFFGPFAEWTNVYMKQMTGGSAQARRIGSDRICNDYLPQRNDTILEYVVL